MLCLEITNDFGVVLGIKQLKGDRSWEASLSTYSPWKLRKSKNIHPVSGGASGKMQLRRAPPSHPHSYCTFASPIPPRLSLRPDSLSPSKDRGGGVMVLRTEAIFLWELSTTTLPHVLLFLPPSLHSPFPKASCNNIEELSLVQQVEQESAVPSCVTQVSMPSPMILTPSCIPFSFSLCGDNQLIKWALSCSETCHHSPWPSMVLLLLTWSGPAQHSPLL